MCATGCIGASATLGTRPLEIYESRRGNEFSLSLSPPYLYIAKKKRGTLPWIALLAVVAVVMVMVGGSAYSALELELSAV